MAEEGCSGIDFFNPACRGRQIVNFVVGDAIEHMANAVMEAFGKAVASLGTIWVHIGTPNLTGTGDEESAIVAGSSAPHSTNITTILAYAMWISLVIAVLSLVALGAIIATRMRAGEGIAAVGKIGLILGAVVLLSAASALVSGLMPAGPKNTSGAVLFLQSSLWWYMGAAAIISVIVGAARMIWEQRAEPGRETVKSLLTLVVVAGAGTTVVALLITAADSFSVWVINASLSCQVDSADSTCFGKNMLSLLALSGPGSGLGAMLIIVLGLFSILATIFQIVLMVARGGMLVILTGILPLSASFTNTEMGKNWFKKCIAWLIAFILYKPAAAIVYAAAFQLVGTNVFSDDGTGLLTVLTGLMLMIIALFAMPALMRFVTPMVSSLAGGSAGGVMAIGAMAAIPTGAAAVGRLASGSSSGSSGSGEEGGSAEPSGGSYSGTSTFQTTQSNGSQQDGSSAAEGGSSASSGTSTGTAAQGVGTAAGGETAAASAAAGPIGLAAGAAIAAGKKVITGVADTAQNLGEQSTGEGGEPNGSR